MPSCRGRDTRLHQELISVEAEMAKAPRALERYFVVFEEGTLRSKRLADLGDLAEVPQEVIEHGTPASVRLSRGAWSPRFEPRAGRRSTHLPQVDPAGQHTNTLVIEGTRIRLR